jgi:hypothetical protein
MPNNPPELLHQKLQRASTRDEVFDALQSAYDSIDELHDQYVAAKSVHLDCGRNCFWCCYLRVGAKAHEILAIANHIEKKFTPRERERLIERLTDMRSVSGR